MAAFTACPLSFRFSVIERYPEPPSPHAVKGTLVHSALEALFWRHPPGERTVQAAVEELDRAIDLLQGDEGSEWAALELAPDDAAAFIDDAEQLVRNYFLLEDPNAVEVLGVELGLEATDGGLRLRGIIDRLDVGEFGDLVVVDYKTGRAPSERFERDKLWGVQAYALLCELVLGRPPAQVRLLHLREPVSIIATPSTQSLNGQRRRTRAVWEAIERACHHEDFRPRRSALCPSCNFQAMCPAAGGAMPVSLVGRNSAAVCEVA